MYDIVMVNKRSHHLMAPSSIIESLSGIKPPLLCRGELLLAAVSVLYMDKCYY